MTKTTPTVEAPAWAIVAATRRPISALPGCTTTRTSAKRARDGSTNNPGSSECKRLPHAPATATPSIWRSPKLRSAARVYTGSAHGQSVSTRGAATLSACKPTTPPTNSAMRTAKPSALPPIKPIASDTITERRVRADRSTPAPPHMLMANLPITVIASRGPGRLSTGSDRRGRCSPAIRSGPCPPT